MTEQLSRGDKSPTGDHSARVDREEDESINPEELTDSEALELLLSQLSHPGSYGKSEELAQYVQRIVGDRVQDGVSEREAAWQARMSELKLDIDDITSSDDHDLVDADPIVNELYAAMAKTRDSREDFKEQRRALLLLIDLRIGAIVRRITSQNPDEEWQSIVDRLVKLSTT